MAKRLKPGDVIAVSTPRASALVQFLGKHRDYGDVVLVSPRRPAPAETPSPEWFADGYVTLFPAGAAVSRGLASVVAHWTALQPVPGRWRRPGAMSGSTILTWLIDDPDGTVTVKEALSPDELRLAIASIWNIEFLVDRVASGWRPEHEGRATRSRDAEPPPTAPGGRSTSHYLYFQSQDAARGAAAALREVASHVDVRPAALGSDWLVLAVSEASDGEAFELVRARIASIAEGHGGVYDGWETAV